MSGRLDGKVALVTGGGSGIGRATALAFAREDAKVVVADLAVEGGEATVRMIEEARGEALFLKADVSKAAEVQALVQRAVETYGRLDCAHNNAGVEGSSGVAPTPTADITEEHWDYTINVNLKGVWLCMKYEIPQMLSQGGGAIVNTASILGLVGIPTVAAYVASKHGVVGLTKTAALEYAQAGLRINAVCPGFIRTPMVERFAELASREKPGSRARLLPPSPLRTTRASCPACRASLAHALGRTRFHHGAPLMSPAQYALGVDAQACGPSASGSHARPPRCGRPHQRG
jgi:NAD(P)-dependent dehydrogenase (short-subunit alcohol dehydrogenase family)